MAGFNAPVVVLGISGGIADQAGFLSPLPFPCPGGGLDAAPEQAGFLSPLPFWNAGGYEGVDDDTSGPGGGNGKGKGKGKGRDDRLHARLLQEDEEMLAVIMVAIRFLQ